MNICPKILPPPLDGVIFRSTQNNRGKNVALFQRALDVESWDIQPGTTYDIRYDNDENEENEVSIVLTRTIKKYSAEEISNFNFPKIEKQSAPTLRLNHADITVERVVAIAYKSTSATLKISEDDLNKNYEF